jgi:hypothetical protein
MFCHAQSKERKSGKKWRLDILSWERYLQNSRTKKLKEKAETWGFEEKICKLKMAQIAATIDALETLNPDSLDSVYAAISEVWA